MANDIRQNIVITAKDQTTRGFRSVQKKLSAVDRLFSRVQTTLLGFVGINIAANIVGGLSRISDTAVELQAKLKLVTDTTQDYIKANKELVAISLNTGSSLANNATLFTRIARPMRSLGFETDKTSKLTRVIAQSLRISGASTQEAASVTLQMSQALASGTLRGEEFRAVNENGVRIMEALAKGLNKTKGELIAMSRQGELTAKTVIEGLLSQAAVIERENAQLPITIGRAIENIKTRFLNFQNSIAGVNRTIADGINLISTNFEQVFEGTLRTAKVAVIVFGALFIKSLKARIIARREEALIAAAQSKAQLAAHNAEIAALKLEESQRERVNRGKLRSAELSAKTSVRQSKLAIVTQRNAQTELRNAKVLAREQVLSSERLLKRIQREGVRESQILRGNISRTKRAAIEARLAANLEKETLATTALNRAKTKLAGVEFGLSASVRKETAARLALSTAIVQQTKATTLLSVAQSANAKTGVRSAITNLIGTVGVATTRFRAMGVVATSALKRIGAAMLGTVGLVALVAFELANFFLDIDSVSNKAVVGVKALDVGFQKLAANAANLLDPDALDADLARIDASYLKWTDRRLRDAEAVAAGFANAYEKQKADAKSLAEELVAIDNTTSRLKLEANQKFEELGLKKLEFQKNLDSKAELSLERTLARFDLELAADKVKLTSKLKNATDLQTAVAKLESDAAETRNKLTISNLSERLVALNEHYTKEEALLKGNSNNVIKFGKTAHKRLIKLQKDRVEGAIATNNKILDVLRERLARASADYQRYSDDVVAAEDRIAELTQQQSDLQSSLLDDVTDARQIAFNKAQTINEAEAKLRKAAQLDITVNAAEIDKLQREALDTLAKVAKGESARAKSSKKGSADALEAELNATNALAVFNQGVAKAKKSQTQLATARREAAVESKKNFEDTAKSISEVTAKVESLDEVLAMQREVNIDVNTTKLNAALSKINKQLDELAARKIKVNVDIVTNEKLDINLPPVKRATGGFIPRRDKVPGSGRGDKVKTLLEPGEYIIKRSSVESLGLDAMRSINAGVLPDSGVQKFATGGEVLGKASGRRERRVDRLIAGFLDSRDTYVNNKQGKGVGGRNITQGRLLGSSSVAAEIRIDRAVNKYFKPMLGLAEQLKDVDNPRVQRRGSTALSEINRSIFGGNEFEVSRIPQLFQDAADRIADGVVPAFDPPVTVTNSFESRAAIAARARNARRERLRAKSRSDSRDEGRSGTSRFAKGGFVERENEVPGQGTGDKVKALLEPGEFIIKRDVVEHIGVDALKSVNEGRVPKFKEGGLVGGNTSPSLMARLTKGLERAADRFARVAQNPLQNAASTTTGSAASISNSVVETINVKFDVGGKTATASFDNSDNTRELLSLLRESGKVA